MQWVPELVIGLTLLAVPLEMMPQQGATPSSSTTDGETSLTPEDEAESYEIYSTVLKVKEPAVLEWTIVQETRAFQICLEPAPDQQIYRPMIDDYAFKNRKALQVPPAGVNVDGVGEWIVHAVTCAKPNLKLRRVLQRRGFVIRQWEGIGEAYHYIRRSLARSASKSNSCSPARSHRHEASLVQAQRYIRIRDSRCLEMILAKGSGGARHPDEEFGGLSAVVVLAEDRLSPEPDNANMLLLVHVTQL